MFVLATNILALNDNGFYGSMDVIAVKFILKRTLFLHTKTRNKTQK